MKKIKYFGLMILTLHVSLQSSSYNSTGRKNPHAIAIGRAIQEFEFEDIPVGMFVETMEPREVMAASQLLYQQQMMMKLLPMSGNEKTFKSTEQKSSACPDQTTSDEQQKK